MENKLFVDTWGLLTLRDKREHRHKEVSKFCFIKWSLYDFRGVNKKSRSKIS